MQSKSNHDLNRIQLAKDVIRGFLLMKCTKDFLKDIHLFIGTSLYLVDYIEYGLTYNQSKKIYNLSSPPWAEARMMQGSAEYGIFDIINSFNKDVLILRASGKKSNENNDIFSKSVTDPDLHKLFSNSTDLLIDDVTHFIPQEKPQECAKIINDHLNLLLKD